MVNKPIRICAYNYFRVFVYYLLIIVIKPTLINCIITNIDTNIMNFKCK